MQQTTELVKAIATLLGSIAWPTLALFVIIKYRSGLAAFFQDLGEFTLKVPGVEASARRQEIKAAVAVGAALAKPGGAPVDTSDASVVAEELADVLPGKRRLADIAGSTILWVDDRPQNNVYERQAMEALGASFLVETSTDAALAALERRSVDLIISDMGRPPDARAGYTLLDGLRKQGNPTPYVIYASSRSPEHVRESREHGAIGCTNSPQELIQLVLRGLRDRRSGRRQTGW